MQWCTSSSTIEEQHGHDKDESLSRTSCSQRLLNCQAPFAVRSCFGPQLAATHPAPHLNPIPEACRDKEYADEDDDSEFIRSRKTAGQRFAAAEKYSSCVVVRRANLGESQRKPLPIIDFTSLRDPDWEKRREAVSKLGFVNLGTQPNDFNSEAAALIMPALRAAMRDEYWQVREQAILSLHDLGREVVWRAAPVLWEACSDREQPVRIAAVQALEAHGQETPPDHMRQPRLYPRSWQEPPRMQSVREDSMSSTTANSDSHSRRGSFSAFTVSVAKSVDSQLGIEVDYTDENTLKISHVLDGVVSDWNKASVSPVVERGDVIMAVNGRQGTSQQLMDMINRSEWVEVLVRKPDAVQSEGSYRSFIISN